MGFTIRLIKNNGVENGAISDIITKSLTEESKIPANDPTSVMEDRCFTHFGKHYGHHNKGRRGYYVIVREECDLHVMSELPQSLEQYKYSYIFIKKNDVQELYYIKPAEKSKKEYHKATTKSEEDYNKTVVKSEKVEINNCNLFEEKINSLLKNKNETKLELSKEQVQSIITANGGHTPTDEIVGGGGFARHKKDDTFEVQRVFIKPEMRGKGLGQELTTRVLNEAFEYYDHAYLESLDSMKAAAALYRKLGFEDIPENEREKSVHSSCPVQMRLSKEKWFELQGTTSLTL